MSNASSSSGSALSPVEVEMIAQNLISAYQTGRTVEPPSSNPAFNLDSAYQVEGRLKQWREASGQRSIGRKVGYANKAMWRVLKLETLVWGHMYQDTVHHSENNSAELSIANPRSLKIEPEIVFGLKEKIPVSGLDAAAALAACDWIALGFEIIDCPYPNWKFQPSDFVASFGLHAALVVGERRKISSEMVSKLAEELPRFKVRMVKSGEVVEEGLGKNSLKSPALCLAELAAAIARRFTNEPLRAGELVSSGTLTSGHLTITGDFWRAEVEGIDLPALSLRIV